MTISDGRRTTLESLFAAIDAKDVAGFVEHLTPDGRFRFGSAPAVTGQAAIAEAVGGFFDTISGLEHRLSMSAEFDSTVVCEGEVAYTRHDGSRIVLPFVDVFEMDGNKIADYKIYMDVAPLYAAA